MRRKKILICTLCLLMTGSPISVLASNTSHHSVESNTADMNIILYGNITGYKYKTMKGKQWKRLWSYTYNKWVDPYWTLA